MSPHAKEIHRAYDAYGVVQILDDGNKRYLSFGAEDEQSCWLKQQPHLPQADYIRAMLLVLLFVQPKRVLCLGLGGGALSHCLHRAFPSLRQQVVELRPAVIDAAYRFGQFPRSKRIEIHQMDAFDYLQEGGGRTVDIIFSDLYDSNGVAEVQLNPAYLFECCQQLSGQGWLVLNCWKEHRADGVLQCLSDYFPVLHTCTTQDGNWVIFAGRQPIGLSSNALRQQARTLSQQLGFSCTAYLNRLSSRDD